MKDSDKRNSKPGDMIYKAYINTKALDHDGFIYKNINSLICEYDYFREDGQSFFLYAHSDNKLLFQLFKETRNKNIFRYKKQPIEEFNQIMGNTSFPKYLMYSEYELTVAELRTIDENEHKIIYVSIPVTENEENSIRTGLGDLIYTKFVHNEMLSIQLEELYDIATKKVQKYLDTLELRQLIYLDGLDVSPSDTNRCGKVCLDELHYLMNAFQETF